MNIKSYDAYIETELHTKTPLLGTQYCERVSRHTSRRILGGNANHVHQEYSQKTKSKTTPEGTNVHIRPKTPSNIITSRTNILKRRSASVLTLHHCYCDSRPQLNNNKQKQQACRKYGHLLLVFLGHLRPRAS
jgi:Tfp pilus assembly protein PilE